MSTVQEGDHVVFRRDKYSRVFNIRSKRMVYFERQKFSAGDLIGQPYGSTFELDGGKLNLVEHVKDLEVPAEAAAEAGADNRNLLDLDSNQKMSKEEIIKLKEDGISGEKLIEKLIENSETFKSKTEFSQAKFLKKKKKKHIIRFTVLRPTARLVLDIFSKEPGKIAYLRADSLSQLLNYSNVMYGSRVAVAESCQGLVLACVLQRMGGSGKLIQLIPTNNQQGCKQVIDYFNFPSEHMDCVYTYPLDQWAALEQHRQPGSGESGSSLPVDMDTAEGADHFNNCEVVKDDSQVISTTEVMPVEGSVETQTPDQVKIYSHGADGPPEKKLEEPRIETENAEDGENFEKWVSNRAMQRVARAVRQKEAGDVIASNQLDSLIIACKYNPVPILKNMLKFMPPSRPVVVFCQFIEPLKDCYTYVKMNHLGLQVRLTETWFREYQVLPQRTHPENNMSGTGGYLLTFMTQQPFDSQTTQSLGKLK